MFRLLTYNILKFHGPVGPERVVPAMAAEGADLICVQEVFNLAVPGFSRNARYILETELPAHGYTAVWFATSGLAVRDGLLLAVKSATFDFSATPDQDYFTAHLSGGLTRRGIQCAMVRERQSGRVIAVCNTHLTVGTEDKPRQRRLREVEGIVQFVSGVEQQHVPEATVLAGDFNAHEGQPEIRRLTVAEPGQTALFQDSFRLLNGTADGFTLDRDRNTIVARRAAKGRFEGNARIDYVLLRPPHGTGGADVVRPVSSRVVLDQPDADTGESLSDHFGVLTEFDVS